MSNESITVKISTSVIEEEKASECVFDPSHGAEVIFSGRVRDHNLGKKVVAVSYDVFEPLAKKALQDLCIQAAKKWGPRIKIAVVHRVGRLLVGEASVVIAVSSPHRDEAYQASRFIIEQIKHEVPIWKKEHYEDGDTEWLKGHALCGV